MLKYLLILTLSIFSLYFINHNFKKYNILCYENNNFHKDDFESLVISGGFYFLFSFSISAFFFDLKNYIFLGPIAFFVIGIMSDKNFKISPLERLVTIFVTYIFILIVSNIRLQEINFLYIDYIIQYSFFNILFLALCLTVLVNGGNFIDGKHGNFILHYILVLIYLSIYEDDIFVVFIIICLPFLIFNCIEKNFLGDSGNYYLSSFFGLLLINLNIEKNFDPFIIANLLAYPIYECCFSFIRRLKINRKSYEPDKQHLHHLINILIKRLLKIKNQYTNILTSIIIFFLNLIHFLIFCKFLNDQLILKKIFFCYFFFYIMTYQISKFFIFNIRKYNS